MDSKKKSLMKALSWRLLAMTITATIGYGVFRDVGAAVAFGLADSVVKIAVYYFHERAWARVDMPDAVAGGDASEAAALTA